MIDVLNAVRRTGLYCWYLIRGSVARIFEEDIQVLASAIAFNAILCSIPIVLLLMSSIGSFLNTSEMAITTLREMLDAAFSKQANPVRTQIEEFLSDIMRYRTSSGIIGFIVLIWTATSLFSSTRAVLNRIYRVQKHKMMLRKILEEIGWVIFIGLLFLAANLTTWIGTLIGPVLKDAAGLLPFNADIILGTIPLAISFMMTLLMFFLIYRFLPDEHVPSRIAFWSALTASTLWWSAGKAFAWYIATYHSYSTLYGAYAFLLILLVWFYYSSMVLIWGAITGQLVREFKPA